MEGAEKLERKDREKDFRQVVDVTEEYFVFEDSAIVKFPFKFSYRMTVQQARILWSHIWREHKIDELEIELNGEPPKEKQRPLKTAEKDEILRALEDCFFVQKDAAKTLGLSKRALNYKIKQHGITHKSWWRNNGLS